MSLEKAIEHGKDRRKPYRKSKAFDRTCRNHGSCSWCEQNRLRSSLVLEEKLKDEAKELPQ